MWGPWNKSERAGQKAAGITSLPCVSLAFCHFLLELSIEDYCPWLDHVAGLMKHIADGLQMLKLFPGASHVLLEATVAVLGLGVA